MWTEFDPMSMAASFTEDLAGKGRTLLSGTT